MSLISNKTLRLDTRDEERRVLEASDFFSSFFDFLPFLLDLEGESFSLKRGFLMIVALDLVADLPDLSFRFEEEEVPILFFFFFFDGSDVDDLEDFFNDGVTWRHQRTSLPSQYCTKSKSEVSESHVGR
jgi:hypothetical protein